MSRTPAGVVEEALQDFASSLVRIPSVLGNEGPVARAVARQMRCLGYDQVEIDEAGNTVGVILGGSGGGPTLLFDAHMDTVDVLPRSSWSDDPFSGRVAGGRIHGHGSSDMKGALAAMVFAAASLDRSQLVGRVVVSASVAEETLEGAALRLVMERYPPHLVVIGEASELNLVRAGRGRAEFCLRTSGTPAHASTPQLGVNAIHKMRAVIGRIEKMPLPSHPFVGPGTLCLTDIVSEPYPAQSVVPSGCRVTYERRLIPGETREELMAEMQAACRMAGASDTGVDLAWAELRSYTGYAWKQPKWFPPWELPESHPLLQASLNALRQAGLKPRLASYQFCTNAAYSAGTAKVPTIGFGPSTEALAHVVDEYLEIGQLAAACLGYRAIMEIGHEPNLPFA